ncbi:hypothetical protein BH11MYX3_BH11MYX3_12290 [soil metagenome]
MRFTPAIVTALVLATGCVGGIDNTDPKPDEPDAGVVAGPMARTLYKTNVHAITNRCTGGACHSVTGIAGGGQSRFSDSNGDTSYDAIIRAPLTVGSFNAQAGILTKIAGGHNGITYTPAEQSSINAWLAEETKEHMGGNQPPVIDPVEVLKKWSGCMTLANFQTAQMAPKWGALAAQNGQKCQNCHQAGLYVFIATTNQTTFFDTISKQKDYLLKYFTVDGAGKIIINTSSFTNAGVTLTTHPHFDPTTNAGMLALKTFYDSTKLLETAGTCGPPTLVP